jgi:DNA-binding FadR family transcriptional regulator
MALQMEDRAQAMLAMQEHIRYVRDCLLDALETTEVPVDQPVASYS